MNFEKRDRVSGHSSLDLVCVSRLIRQAVSVVFKEIMFTRYQWSVLRHELSHSTQVATFKAGMPMRGNDAGLGPPPGAAAHQGRPGAGGEVVAAARSSLSRTLPRRALRCVSAWEFRAKFCGGRGCCSSRSGTSAPYPGERVQL